MFNKTGILFCISRILINQTSIQFYIFSNLFNIASSRASVFFICVNISGKQFYIFFNLFNITSSRDYVFPVLVYINCHPSDNFPSFINKYVGAIYFLRYKSVRFTLFYLPPIILLIHIGHISTAQLNCLYLFSTGDRYLY